MVGKTNYEPLSECQDDSGSQGRNWHTNFVATLAFSSTKGIPLLIKVELVEKSSINAGITASLMTTVEPC